MNPKPLFELQNQHLSYRGKQVLTGIDLSIHRGEKVALLGKSGSGKSSLIKLFYHQQRSTTALCPQQLGLVPMLSVFHNIYMGRLNRHRFLYNLTNLIKPREIELKQIGQLAEQLGLADKLYSSVDQLSGGQMQRTALGRALYQQSPIFLGDEPVSSVDRYQAQTLLQLANQRFETVVVVLHDQHMARQCFDRVIGLRGGRIVLDSPSHQLSDQQLAEVYRS